METITFRCYADIAKKLRSEPNKNRLFNNYSEICRTVLEIYLTDTIVKKCVNQGIKRKYVDLIDKEIV